MSGIENAALELLRTALALPEGRRLLREALAADEESGGAGDDELRQLAAERAAAMRRSRSPR